ncbi:hypothetical protein, partial [Oleiphilus sp. HI0043]
IPEDVSNSKAQISRFQHELNIPQSTALGSALDSKQIEVALGKPSRITRQYAEELRCTLVASDMASENTSTSSAIWFANTVKHVVLGLGWVKEESGNAFSVEFEDKELRTFSKETADRFFTVLD